MRAQGKVHPASQTPPKHWVLGSVEGCTEHAGSQSCCAVQPDVGEASVLQVKLLPRRGGDTCAHPRAHACRGGTRRAQAQILRLDVPTSPARSTPAARVCLAPWASRKPQLSRRRAATSSPDQGTTRPRAGLAASCPSCQTPQLGHRASCRGAGGHPSAPAAPGACRGAGLLQGSAPMPHACFARCPDARIQPGPGAGTLG